jgi:hypothetical protein
VHNTSGDFNHPRRVEGSGPNFEKPELLKCDPDSGQNKLSRTYTALNLPGIDIRPEWALISMSIFGLVVLNNLHILVDLLSLAQSRLKHGLYTRRHCLRRQ